MDKVDYPSLPDKPKAHQPHEGPPPRLAYRYDEACYLLGDISRWVLWEIINAGELRPIEGHQLISHAELERYLNAKTKRQTTARGRRKRGEV